jgi:feruloyl esterase
MTTRRMWEIIQRDTHQGLMSPADWRLLADEGVKTCDALDGVTDGVAEDPRACRFDPAALLCDGRNAGRCLSPEQVRFAQTLYRPLKDENGRAIDEGLLPGILVDSGRSRLALATFGQAIRRDPAWNGEGFSVARDLAAIRKVMPELAADRTDVGPLRRRGGKIILYQGWMDPAVAGRMTLAYRQDVARANGGDAAAGTFMRLFMVPGMGHCAGGPGADQIGGSGADAPVVDPEHDLLSALERWVEQGRPPERIIASKLADGRVVRTRLLCPAPARARYGGRGSTDDAASYGCIR